MGRVSWPDTTNLLWPHGISVLVDGVGPLNAILALPFWPWGAAAAFNGTALLGIALSGWSLYALARGIGLSRGPAFVAGALFLLWPMHLIAITGHLEKLFVGMLPLTLLAGLRAFDPGRGRAWLAVPGVALLGALLQNGNQFIFAALGVAFVGVQTWLAAPVEERRPRLRRMVIAGALSLVICAPLLLALVNVMRDPTLFVALGEHTRYYSPDALSLVLPAPHQRWAAWLFPSDMHLRNYVWAPTLPALGPTEDWYGTGLETAVTIPLAAIALCVLAWRERAGRPWVIFGLVFAVLCLGPRLRIGGAMLPIAMPYDALQHVPGLDVMRTPGRFMMLGSIGFALAAGVGVSALMRRRPSASTAVMTVAALVDRRGVLAENLRADRPATGAGVLPPDRVRRPAARAGPRSAARLVQPQRSGVGLHVPTRRSIASRSRGRTCRATTSGFRTKDSIPCGTSGCPPTRRSGPG